VAERNVLGADLQPCGTDPMTGFYRDGCCSTGPEDVGSHTICAVVTAEFLDHQRSIGNDLSTPRAAVPLPGTDAGRPLVRDRGELGPCLQRRRGCAGRACLHQRSGAADRADGSAAEARCGRPCRPELAGAVVLGHGSWLTRWTASMAPNGRSRAGGSGSDNDRCDRRCRQRARRRRHVRMLPGRGSCHAQPHRRRARTSPVRVYALPLSPGREHATPASPLTRPEVLAPRGAPATVITR
jgi:uncharacterized protein